MEEGYITSAVGYFWRVVEAGARGELKRLGVLEEIAGRAPDGAPNGSIAQVAELALMETTRNLDNQLQREITEKPLDVYPRVIGVLSAQLDYALEFHNYHNIRTDGAFRGNMTDFAMKNRLRTVVAYLAAFERRDYNAAERELIFLRRNKHYKRKGEGEEKEIEVIASLVGVDIDKQIEVWEGNLKRDTTPIKIPKRDEDGFPKKGFRSKVGAFFRNRR